MGSAMGAYAGNTFPWPGSRSQRPSSSYVSVRENGPSDKRYALVIFQLGEVSRLEGQESQADAYYWEALPLFAQSVGPEHLRMADPLTALSSLYHDKGQPEMAVPLLKRALTIREKSWGPSSDPRLLSTLQTYHALLLTADHREEAMEITDRIERIQKNHPNHSFFTTE
jgi:tetratricopeptide (TPR) repeat protein